MVWVGRRQWRGVARVSSWFKLDGGDIAPILGALASIAAAILT